MVWQHMTLSALLSTCTGGSDAVAPPAASVDPCSLSLGLPSVKDLHHYTACFTSPLCLYDAATSACTTLSKLHSAYLDQNGLSRHSGVGMRGLPSPWKTRAASLAR